MDYKVVELNCPGCGAAITMSQEKCEYCDRPVIITTFNSAYSMTQQKAQAYAKSCSEALTYDPNNADINSAAAMCYLRLKMYDKALSCFEKAIDCNLDNSETYFYAAVSLLRGKKAFLAQRADINKAEEYINAALMIEPRGIYHYLLAYIKYDYYERKYLNTSPSYKECLNLAHSAGTSAYDIDMLFNILGVSKPEF